ncbi:MAG: hypothetical protein K1X94_07070 [Sandaracinaceae bacterium]|nr:hypothetical protein [Sandaracinaceae bacterium]
MPDGFESWVRVRPRAIFADDATMRVAEAIVPAARLDAFRDRHGVEVRTLELLSIASYADVGTIALASGPFHAHVVAAEIGHRMAPLESSADHPLVRRAGIYQLHRFELIALGAHELGLVEGPPELSGLLVHTRDRGAPTGASPSRLRMLIAAESEAPFLVVHHGRPELPPGGIGLVLARLEDAALGMSSAGPSDPGALELRVWLFGEFPPGVDENLRTLVASLSEADLGRAVGLEEVARSLSIDTLDREVRMTARVRATTLARGLRVLLGAEIEEMLDDAT